MEVIDKKYTLIHNRGAKGAIKLSASKTSTGTFKKDDVIKFSIVTKDNYDDVVFQKEFTVQEECTEFFLTFTNEEMRIGNVISNKVEYYYEIELNNDTTLIGSYKDGHKKFVLYPEAGKKKEAEN